LRRKFVVIFLSRHTVNNNFPGNFFKLDERERGMVLLKIDRVSGVDQDPDKHKPHFTMEIKQ